MVVVVVECCLWMCVTVYYAGMVVSVTYVRYDELAVATHKHKEHGSLKLGRARDIDIYMLNIFSEFTPTKLLMSFCRGDVRIAKLF